MQNRTELDIREQKYSDKIVTIPSGDSILETLDLDTTKIKSIKPFSKRTQYRAIINWLTKYQPHVDSSNLEKVKGLLEAFYHLCEVEEWERVSKLFIFPLNSSSESQLYWLLFIWGYYQEQLKLCGQLVPHQLQLAREHCENGLKIATELGIPLAQECETLLQQIENKEVN